MKTTISTLICMSMLVSIRSSRRPENDSSSLSRHQILHLTPPISIISITALICSHLCLVWLDLLLSSPSVSQPLDSNLELHLVPGMEDLSLIFHFLLMDLASPLGLPHRVRQRTRVPMGGRMISLTS